MRRNPTRPEYFWTGRYPEFALLADFALEIGAKTICDAGGTPDRLALFLPEMKIAVRRLEAGDDIRDLPFADGAFDLAVCQHVLEHAPVEDRKAILRELWRIARLAVFVSVPSGQEARRIDMLLAPRHPHAQYLPIAWLDMRRWFERVGATEIRTDFHWSAGGWLLLRRLADLMGTPAGDVVFERMNRYAAIACPAAPDEACNFIISARKP